MEASEAPGSRACRLSGARTPRAGSRSQVGVTSRSGAIRLAGLRPGPERAPGTRAPRSRSTCTSRLLTAGCPQVPGWRSVWPRHCSSRLQRCRPQRRRDSSPETGRSSCPPTTEPLVGVPQLITPGAHRRPVRLPRLWRVDLLGSLRLDPPGACLPARHRPLRRAWPAARCRLGGPALLRRVGTIRAETGSGCATGRATSSSTRTCRRSRLLARNGAHVHAGQVIGFMGDTGDLQGEPTHVHFEVHPVSMLSLGADGAVDPTTYLKSWHRIASLVVAAGSKLGAEGPGDDRGAGSRNRVPRELRHLDRRRSRSGGAAPGRCNAQGRDARRRNVQLRPFVPGGVCLVPAVGAGDEVLDEPAGLGAR